MMAVFDTKRDAWIVVLIWGGALVSGYGAVAQLASDAAFPMKAAMALVLGAAALFLLWVLYGTDYTLEQERLIIRCGPFRYRVPLAEIVSVRPSRNPLSSPACSLDRLLITWKDGRRRILISPAQKRDFLQALGRRCPQLESAGDGLVHKRGK